MKFRIYLFILLFSVTVDAQQNDPTEPYTVPENPLEEYEELRGYNITTKELEEGVSWNESLAERNFEDNFKDKYQTSEFDYTLTKPRESLWSRIKRKLNEWISYFMRSSDANSINNVTEWILRIVAVGILGLAVYWLLRFLVNKEGPWFFSRKNKELNPEVQTIKENIHKIDFQTVINQYETEKNYRFAVRYQYLHLLKMMTDHRILEWDTEKTNLDYISEVKDEKMKETFKNLTYVFDYVWYGEFPVEEPAYANYKARFNQMKNSL